MYKFGFNYFKIMFKFAPCIMGQREFIPGHTGLNKKDKGITNFIS